MREGSRAPDTGCDPLFNLFIRYVVAWSLPPCGSGRASISPILELKKTGSDFLLAISQKADSQRQNQNLSLFFLNMQEVQSSDHCLKPQHRWVWLCSSVFLHRPGPMGPTGGQLNWSTGLSPPRPALGLSRDSPSLHTNIRNPCQPSTWDCCEAQIVPR